MGNELEDFKVYKNGSIVIVDSGAVHTFVLSMSLSSHSISAYVSPYQRENLIQPRKSTDS